MGEQQVAEFVEHDKVLTTQIIGQPRAALLGFAVAVLASDHPEQLRRHAYRLACRTLERLASGQPGHRRRAVARHINPKQFATSKRKP